MWRAAGSLSVFRCVRAVSAVAILLTTLVACTTGPQVRQRIDLRVLVLSADDDGTEAMVDALRIQGVPFTEVDLSDRGRTQITPEFLSTTTAGVRHSKFQAIVVPNDSPPNLSAAEHDAIVSAEVEFGLRQVEAYLLPNASSGMNPPLYSGSVDGATASLTTAAKGGAWSYLNGSVPFDDVSSSTAETWGYLSLPLPNGPTTQFTPMVTMAVPGSGEVATIIGQFDEGGRQRLVVTVAVNQWQTQFHALFEGIVNWATRGVHLGAKRNYFVVQSDDVFMADDRWSIADNCTPGEDCPVGVTTTPIRMNAADVAYLRDWQTRHDFRIDQVFNGYGYDNWIAEHGSDPAGQALIDSQSSFRWVNHTYGHEYLGCEKNSSVIPWVCRTDANGNVVWATSQFIQQQVADNISWAAQHGITIDPRELVTGEHGGLRRTPQEPSDNPAFSPVLASLGIESVASDLSREPRQRRIGDGTGPRTLPRYPFNVFYNTGTKAELVDEYNWIYNSRADGGSGTCEIDPNSTCIAPLPSPSGYDDYIAPLEARNALLRTLNGWPYPHFAHQSNLTEDRLLLPVVEKVLDSYRAIYAPSAPILNPGQLSSTDITERIQAWQDEMGTGTDDVNAYTLDGQVHLETARAVNVPLTVPNGSTASAVPFGEGYAGLRSGWTSMAAGQAYLVALP